MCKMLNASCSDSMEQLCKPSFIQCYFCGGPTNSLKIISNDIDSMHERTCYIDLHTNARKKVNFLVRLIYVITILIIYVNFIHFYDLVNYHAKKFLDLILILISKPLYLNLIFGDSLNYFLFCDTVYLGNKFKLFVTEFCLGLQHNV